MKNLLMVLLLIACSMAWCDSQQIQSKSSLTSSQIFNNDDRATFADHLGDVIFVEMFATT
ncbi:hypothetical protein [Candidatus Uabimicrobium amorphum]|uniref:Redoxin domain-containing protein n=1 Tax=Uabimicrobium amorphum TaxID=2596890 RepID=A0A5S9F414_UABAM|nr:hypothetical protein [Candidatus Uabimicrobium amorphum]BBM85325.1 hypothetical protein UABAM_03691 [Candidatus Uabimicrobium amorphum]